MRPNFNDQCIIRIEKCECIGWDHTSYARDSSNFSSKKLRFFFFVADYQRASSKVHRLHQLHKVWTSALPFCTGKLPWAARLILVRSSRSRGAAQSSWESCLASLENTVIIFEVLRLCRHTWNAKNLWGAYRRAESPYFEHTVVHNSRSRAFRILLAIDKVSIWISITTSLKWGALRGDIQILMVDHMDMHRA